MKKFAGSWIFLFVLAGSLFFLTNSCKKSDSDETPAPSNAITDIDGNVYHAVTIGTQVWMVENLKTTKYCNGDPIVCVTGNAQWYSQTTGGYCNYGNAVANGAVYGLLYNFSAVCDERKLAPAGWHVASDEEWMTLSDYLGGASIAGGKLKETGTLHWESPNQDATNESGFTALPGGNREEYGNFYNASTYSDWWTSTGSTSLACYRSLTCMSGALGRCFLHGNSGCYVRCIKD